MAEISIIVPVYKVEQYLNRCLDSIVAQTFTGWECILIDDGSPDNSGKMCDEYAKKDGRFRVYHQKNAGVSSARNKGVDESKSEWVVFVDSDDWIEKEMLSMLYECAITNNAEIVVCGCFLYDGVKRCKTYLPKSGLLNIPRDFIWCLQGPWSKLINRNLLIKSNIRFPLGITLAEDLYFVFQCFIHANRIIGIDNALYNYVKNTNSVTKRLSEKNIQDHICVINKIQNDLCNNNGWEQWILTKKQSVKNLCINGFKDSNFTLWWHVFPEINYCFKKLNIFNIICKILIILRLNVVCRFIVKIKRKILKA